MEYDKKIIVVAHDIRSTHNVGSLFRTADTLAVNHVYLTGYTPHPSFSGDARLAHLAEKQTRAIQKTSLGAEKTISWSFSENINELLISLKQKGFVICGLEQDKNSILLHQYSSPKKVVLMVGNEVEGLPEHLLQLCDTVLEIPMLGEKESLNVVQAAAMALYHLRFFK